MSSYPPAYPQPQLLRPPTDVVGRRIGAYFLDGLIGALLSVAVILTMLHHTTGNPSHTCSNSNVQDHTSACVQLNGDVYSVAEKDSWKILLAQGGWFLAIQVALQGFAGGTLGKLIVGIRVVDSNGSICGPWRAFVRSIPFALGTTGYAWNSNAALTAAGVVASIAIIIEAIAILAKRDHRRFGDLAAGTFVVNKHAVGHAVPDPDTFLAQQAWGGQAWPQPGWGPGTPPLPQQPEHLPQWDSARDTYIWWDAEQSEWLEHDRTSGEWRPISR